MKNLSKSIYISLIYFLLNSILNVIGFIICKQYPYFQNEIELCEYFVFTFLQSVVILILLLINKTDHSEFYIPILFTSVLIILSFMFKNIGGFYISNIIIYSLSSIVYILNLLIELLFPNNSNIYNLFFLYTIYILFLFINIFLSKFLGSKIIQIFEYSNFKKANNKNI